jgi:hypothetical protein
MLGRSPLIGEPLRRELIEVAHRALRGGQLLGHGHRLPAPEQVPEEESGEHGHRERARDPQHDALDAEPRRLGERELRLEGLDVGRIVVRRDDGRDVHGDRVGARDAGGPVRCDVRDVDRRQGEVAERPRGDDIAEGEAHLRGARRLLACAVLDDLEVAHLASDARIGHRVSRVGVDDHGHRDAVAHGDRGAIYRHDGVHRTVRPRGAGAAHEPEQHDERRDREPHARRVRALKNAMSDGT